MKAGTLPGRTWLWLMGIVFLGGFACAEYHTGRYEIMVDIQPSNRFISGQATIRVEGRPREALFFFLNRQLTVNEITLDGQAVLWDETQYIPETAVSGDPATLQCARRHARVIVLRDLPISGEKVITIRYYGEFSLAGAVGNAGDISRVVPQVIIGARGVLLPSEIFWYPTLQDGRGPIQVTIEGPEEYQFLSGGSRISATANNGKNRVIWRQAEPMSRVALAGIKCELREDRWRNVPLLLYRDQGRGEDVGALVKTAQDLLKSFSDLYGSYPLKTMALMEFPFPVVYGWPGAVILGEQTARSEGRKKTAIAHELLRSWWGYRLQVDVSGGDWSEGLLTYLGDHYVLEQEGAEQSAEFRKELIEEYAQYPELEQRALSTFFGGVDQASLALGRSKGALVFHMLRRHVGDEVFFEALAVLQTRSQGTRISWADFRQLMENLFAEKHKDRLENMTAKGIRIPEYEKDKDLTLGWFFRQWVHQPGAPALSIKVKDLFRPMENQFLLAFVVGQAPTVYQLEIPVFFHGEKGVEKRTLTLDGLSKEYQVFLPEGPKEVRVDERYEVFRALWTGEQPATIGAVSQQENLAVQLPEDFEIAGIVKECLQGDLGFNPRSFTDSFQARNSQQNRITFLTPSQISDRRWRDAFPPVVRVTGNEIEIDGQRLDISRNTVAIAFVPKDTKERSQIIVIIGEDIPGFQKTLTTIFKVNGAFSYVEGRNGNMISRGRWRREKIPLNVAIH